MEIGDGVGGAREEAGMRMEMLPPEPSRTCKFPMSTPEFFAAHFLTRIETDMTDIDLPDEYKDDPRAKQIGHAMRSEGVSRVRIVGGGSFGLAAATPGRIAKLTSDETETRAASVLRGKRLPHVAHVYGAWNVAGVEVDHWYSGPTKIGLILQEKVEPIDTHDDLGESLTEIWSDVRHLHGATPNELMAMPREWARKVLYESSVDLERKLIEGHAKTGYRLFRDVADALAELREQGIYAIDVHAGNVGYSEQDNVYKLFDVGSSSSPEGAEAPEASERGRRARAPLQTPAMVDENVVVDEIGGTMTGMAYEGGVEECRLERSYGLPDGRKNHQVSVPMDGERYVVVVTTEDREVVHTQSYVGLLRQPTTPSSASERAESRARRIVRESLGRTSAEAEEAPIAARNYPYKPADPRILDNWTIRVEPRRPWAPSAGWTWHISGVDAFMHGRPYSNQQVYSSPFGAMDAAKRYIDGRYGAIGTNVVSVSLSPPAMQPRKRPTEAPKSGTRTREAHEGATVDAASLPFALVRQGADVVPVLLGNEDGELLGIDIVNERVLNFGPSDILGLVNAEPAAVWYGAQVEVQQEEGRMAAEDVEARVTSSSNQEELRAYANAKSKLVRWGRFDDALERWSYEPVSVGDLKEYFKREELEFVDGGTVRAWFDADRKRPTLTEYYDRLEASYVHDPNDVDPIVVVRWPDGRLHVADGRHRAAIAILHRMKAVPAVVGHARVYVDAREAQEAGDKRHPAPEGLHAKKGDVTIAYPGFRGRKGMPFQVRPRGQRFQWTPEKPQGMTAFPEVKPVLMRQREQLPSLASIQMAAIFAGLTVHAGTDEAEETFGMLLQRYHAMHGSWPPIQEVMDILRRHNPTLRGNLYESVPAWSQIVQDLLKQGLRDRELRRHIWLELSGEDQVASLGLAKMSLCFMLLGQNVCCLDTWMLGAAFAENPFGDDLQQAAIRRREVGDRISGQWKWQKARKTRELGLTRYEQCEDAILKNNPWCQEGPIWRAQCQWESWQWALGVPAYHQPWLEITKKIHAQAEFPRPDAPF